MRINRRKGLTLIEVMIAIMLLGIITIAILPMSIYSARFAKWNTIRQNANSIAYTQVEWLKTLDYNTELELKGKYFPPGKDGISVEGIVEEDLFMNEINTNPKVIDGINYNILTNIYWESGVSTTGEIVANALRKVDVTVKAIDPVTRTEKEYSVIGSLIAFEGERRPDNTTPFKVKAFKGHDFTELTKNVKIEIYNETGTSLRNWARTDENGEAVFVGLENDEYQVKAKEWQIGDMMSKPNSVKDNFPSSKWESYDLIEINNSEEAYIEHSVFVDYPGYIEIHDVTDQILLNSELKLEPIYTSPEGEVLDLNLKINLTNLDKLKIWRAWTYNHSILYEDVEYKLIEKDTRRVWNGVFSYNYNKPTTKHLTLGYVLESQEGPENIYMYDKNNNTMDIEVIFPKSIISEQIESNESEATKFDFSLYDGDNQILFTVNEIRKIADNNKYRITLNTDYNILNGESIRFILNESIIDSNGLGMIADINFITLRYFEK